MANSQHTTEAQSEAQRRPDPAAQPEQSAVSAGGWGHLYAGGGSPDEQTRRLADPRFQAVQRQAIASQIGRVHGNQHLQRVVASLARADAPAFRRAGSRAHAPHKSHEGGRGEAEAAQPAAAEGQAAIVAGPPTAAASEPPPSAAAPALAQRIAQPATPHPGSIQRMPTPPLIQRGFFDAVANPRQAALGKIAEFAQNIPGYPLLTVVLGKDPISDRPVERNAVNLIRGFMSLVPGGNKLFETLQESGAIDKAYAWFTEQIEKLGLTWSAIKGLFRQAWDALSVTDLLNPIGAWNKIKAIFLPPLERLKNFAVATGKKVLEFIFEGVLAKLGGQQILGIIKRAGAAFDAIVNDPIGFVGNLIKAVVGGFKQFAGNILTHLKSGLMGWLFGALQGAGIQLPQKFDLQGILGLVLQLLGLTYNHMRARLVKLIGEQRVKAIENTFAFVKLIAEKGLAAAWEKILEYVGSLKEMVIDAIKDFVITKIVTAAVTKLVSMFNPAGAIIQAIMAIYNTVMFFVERAQQIAALANAVFDSIATIASGQLGAAISFVEQTMARALPVIISFLARLLGLGGIAEKIREIIKKIQGTVEKAIGKLVGFVVSKVKGLFGKGKAGKPDERTEAQKKADEDAAAADAERILKAKDATPESVQARLPSIKQKYRLTSISLASEGDDKYHVTTLINRSKTGSWKFDPKKDVDWRETDKGCKEALEEAFRRTGVPKSEFTVTKWGKDALGKSHPVEWRVVKGPNKGAEVNVDFPVPGEKGPSSPHVGYQTPGKRGAGGAVRGHILLKTVPYNRGRINS